eukprot:6477356-Alexandrium_andersonii.AAC.1
MSASLVGSEMCIRDRYFARVPSAFSLQLSNVRMLCMRRTLCASGTPSAVSYTHLTLPTICSV